MEPWYDLIFEAADFFESQAILAFCNLCVEFLVLQQHRGIWDKSTADVLFPILRHMILLGVESFAVVNGLRSFFLLTYELLRMSTTAKQVAPVGVDDCGSASAGDLDDGPPANVAFRTSPGLAGFVLVTAPHSVSTTGCEFVPLGLAL